MTEQFRGVPFDQLEEARREPPNASPVPSRPLK
jgi:hypothetical protein